MTIQLVAVAAEGGASARTGSIRGVPVRLDSVRRAGAPLADGFTVAPGSVLLGDVFPAEPSRPLTAGWQAVLLVTGDPINVIEHFTTQGAAAGMSPGVLIVCQNQERVPLVGINCNYDMWADQVLESRGLTIELERSPRNRRFAQPVSSMVLRYWNPPSTNSQEQTLRGSPTEFPPAGIQVPQLPRGWGSLPEAGQPFGSIDGECGLRVERGSQFVAPLSAATSAAGGCTAVLRVSGNPRKVIEQYARQFTSVNTPSSQSPGESSERTDNNVQVLEAINDEPGSATFSAYAMVRAGTPTYLLIKRNND